MVSELQLMLICCCEVLSIQERGQMHLRQCELGGMANKYEKKRKDGGRERKGAESYRYKGRSVGDLLIIRNVLVIAVALLETK